MKKLSDVSLSLILCLLGACSNQSMAGLHAPYPPSKTITKLTWAPEVVKMKGCDTAALGIIEAPKPWGPWSTVYYDDPANGGFWNKPSMAGWSVEDGKDCRTYHPSNAGFKTRRRRGFPPKWMSVPSNTGFKTRRWRGQTMWLLYSGLDCGLYSFCSKKAVLEVAGRESPDLQPEVDFTGTFSIVAVDPKRGVCGAAVASKYPSVGKVVPYVRAGVGAFCTQHLHNPDWGELALDLLAKRYLPEQVLAELLRNDAQRDKRQLAIIDMSGRAANRNPAKADPSGTWWGAVSGKYYACQGNTLVGREVIFAMARAYEETEGSLTDRLMAALIAGDCAGGDHRGRLAAGIRVAKEGIDGYRLELHIDKSGDAVIPPTAGFDKDPATLDLPKNMLLWTMRPKVLGEVANCLLSTLVPTGQDHRARPSSKQPSFLAITRCESRREHVFLTVIPIWNDRMQVFKGPVNDKS